MPAPSRPGSESPSRAVGTGPRRVAVLVILGPTAVGKSRIAIEAARTLNGEVISADSRAFFRGLDVATDKIPTSDRKGVPHHLYDIVEATGRYDAMAFREDVDRLIQEIDGRGHVPIVCGGGTLYLGAILRGLFAGPSADAALRQELSLVPPTELHARLERVDPSAAQRIHQNDRLRLVRALEVQVLTGRPISAWQEEATPLPHRFVPIGLTREKEDHRAAIAARVKGMIERGLVTEVKGLREQGLEKIAQAYRTIGVREAFAFLEGGIPEEELEEAIVRNTWALVRRQTAWFRGDKDVAWIDVTGRSPEDVAGEIVERFKEALKEEEENARGK